MSDRDEERFNLDKCLDNFYLVVLWSSDKDGLPGAPSYCEDCIVQVVAKFNPLKGLKELESSCPTKFVPDLKHFTKIFIVGVDQKTGKVCFVSDPPTGTWKTVEDYLIQLRDNPQFITDLIKNQCETSPTVKRNPYPELVHETLYGRGGIFSL